MGTKTALKTVLFIPEQVDCLGENTQRLVPVRYQTRSNKNRHEPILRTLLMIMGKKTKF